MFEANDVILLLFRLLPKTVQIVLFSATFPPKVIHYAKLFAPNANEITLKADELTVEGIKQLYLDCDSEEEKYDVLVKFYGLLTIGSSVIFVKVCKKHPLPLISSHFLLILCNS